ncbi:MAG: replicative DNA helicase [Shewanella sp.]
MTQDLDKLRNVEAEAMILSAMLLHNGLIDRTADRLSEDDFYETAHAGLFAAIVKEASLGKAVSPVTLQPYLSAIAGLSDLGGVKYLLQLTESTGSGFMLEDCAKQVAELSKRRRILAGLEKASEMVADMGSSISDVTSSVDAALTDKGAIDGVVQSSAVECLDALLQQTDADGVQCHVIPEFDQIAGKFRKKELIILAGRPGMGKTACALSYSLGAAQAGHGVLFVSLEMSGTELAARMAADLCFDGSVGVPYSALRDNRLSSNQASHVVKARRILADLPFCVVDAGKLTTGRLSMIVMRTKRRMEAAGISLDLVVVDYLQLMSPDSVARSMYEKVSEISMALKAIAKTHNVAVVALAQLSREVEKRPDKRPQLSDLRDSGQIEQDADGVMFLVRQAYYMKQDEPDKDDISHSSWQANYDTAEHEIEFICAKRRNGVTGSEFGKFYGQFQAVRGKFG